MQSVEHIVPSYVYLIHHSATFFLNNKTEYTSMTVEIIKSLGHTMQGQNL